MAKIARLRENAKLRSATSQFSGGTILCIAA